MSGAGAALLVAWLLSVLLVWGLLLAGVGRWGRGHRLAPGSPPQDGEALAICIPARDEERNLDACLRAARATRWDRLEIVVVDDRSRDATGAIAAAHAAADARVRVLSGTEPPPGWAGKPWACQTAASATAAPLLLFVDADVRLHPDCVAAVVAARRACGADLLSVFGTWELVGFWEKVLIPAVGWLIRGAVDLDAVEDPARPEAFANGQLILVGRDLYDRVGGHEAVRAEVLDDVRLARAIKSAGGRLALRHAPWAFAVRLYRSLPEILAGYGKNLFEGLGRRRGPAVVGALLIWALAVAPALALLPAIGHAAWEGGPRAGAFAAGLGAAVLLQVAYRFRLERADGRSGALAWTHPLANCLLLWLLVRSMGRREAVWKGRRFDAGRATGSSPP